MPEIISLPIELTGLLRYDNIYATARSAEAGKINASGVGQFYRSGYYGIYRGLLAYDYSDTEQSAEIISATLRIIIADDSSDTDFDINLVAGDFNLPISLDTYDQLQSTVLGTLATAGMGTGIKTMTINSAGIEYLNSVTADKIYFGLRSSKDIAGIMPTQDEYVMFGNIELILTTSDWPDYRFPQVPAFPDIGHADLYTYSAIVNYLTDMTMFGKMMVTGGDIMLVDWPAGGGGITQDMMKYLKIGTETMREESLVTVNATSCSNNSLFNLLGDLDGQSLHINNSGSIVCDNLYVLGNFLCSDADFLEFQADIDDLVSYYKAYNVTDLPTISEAILCLFPATGDFALKRRSSGGTLVIDYIVDYSEV